MIAKRASSYSPHYILSRFITFCVLGVVLCSACIAGVAFASPGPVGPVFPASDRPLPPPGWWRTCTDSSGTRVAIKEKCSYRDCRRRTDLVIERVVGSSGAAVSYIQVNEKPAEAHSYRVACHKSGWFVAQWKDYEDRCYLHRVYGPDGAPYSEPFHIADNEQDCRIRPSVAVQAGGGITAVWAEPRPEGHSEILARHFEPDGTPASAGRKFTESADGWRRQPKVVVDEAGLALIAWSDEAGEEEPASISARFMGRDGKPFGQAFRVSSFEFGSNGQPAIVNEDVGLFQVLWSNPLQGGRVARRVRSGNGVPVALSAQPPASESGPALQVGAPRIVDSVAAGAAELSVCKLTSGMYGTWTIEHIRDRYLLSPDDGRTWSGPASIPMADLVSPVLGTDSKGTWIALAIDAALGELRMRRSDDGLSWGGTATALSPGFTLAGVKNHEIVRSGIYGSSTGTWIVVWTFRGSSQDPGSGQMGTSGRVYALRSIDGGATWRYLNTLTSDLGAGQAGFDLLTDDRGTWVLMSADKDVVVSRSDDDGATWTPPQVLAEDIVCLECSRHNRYRRLDLAHDGAGTWIASFASPNLQADTLGHDGDIFAIRSTDDAVSWSAPTVVPVYSSTDGANDSAPSIISDRTGQWLITWTSNNPHSSGDGLVADLFAATSSDRGESWSGPAILTGASDEADMNLDMDPILARNGNDMSMLAWRSLRFGSTELPDTHLFLVSALNANCGDGRLDAAEQCDDNNVLDGDGCDSNCTSTSCGNGITTTGEGCDDANRRDDDACTGACTVAACGDGVVFGGIEECDDGNGSNADDCLDSCTLARCGDGYVRAGMEECDDGNHSDGDACVKGCRLATCGDGYIQVGVERCRDDDGRLGIVCPVDCGIAVCGDGHTSRGLEECDHADPLYGTLCTKDCTFVDICGDANGDGRVSITDAQRILNHSVGVSGTCPKPACDMDGNGVITVPDAGMALKKTIGIEVGAFCSIGTGTVVFWIDDRHEFGALQLDVAYGNTGGEFVGVAHHVECEARVDALAAFNDNDGGKVLTAGLVNAHGFSGPAEIFACAFDLSRDDAGGGFVIEIVDVSPVDRADGEVGKPRVGYRLE